LKHSLARLSTGQWVTSTIITRDSFKHLFSLFSLAEITKLQFF
jgi:hypothetical protein